MPHAAAPLPPAPARPGLSPRTDHPLRAGVPIPADAFAFVRRRMLLHCCKWDPQVGDVSTLTPFPLLIAASDWAKLCRWSEALAAETIAAEQELLHRPDLHRTLALPRPLREALRVALRLGQTPAALRVMRFDFHWTTDGWQISEVNSDVPGGFAEASDFPALVAAAECAAETAKPHPPSPGTPGEGRGEGPESEISNSKSEISNLRIQISPLPPGDPAAAWADALCTSVGPTGHVALLAAPGFMEDQQVAATFARLLRARGLTPHLADPSHVRWMNGHAHLRAAWHAGPLAAVVRFYQAEWLARLPRRVPWLQYFAGGRTPVTNPGSAVLTESKRFPLVWDELKTPLPTWRCLLPESLDPRTVPWARDERWLLKTALCNTGDTVTARDWLPPKKWRSARRDARLRPGRWVAQRRFETVPVPTPAGDLYPCVGVYTINGAAAGAYTRASPRPVIDYRAADVALLVEAESPRSATG